MIEYARLHNFERAYQAVDLLAGRSPGLVSLGDDVGGNCWEDPHDSKLDPLWLETGDAPGVLRVPMPIGNGVIKEMAYETS